MPVSPFGIVFDCDGTLIDSMDAWRQVEQGLAERAGAQLTPYDVDVLTTMSIPECAAYLHDTYGLGSSAQQVIGMIDQSMLDYYCQSAFERPGALDFVRELHEQGVLMSVASSSPKEYLLAGLERCGFLPYLQAVVSVDEVGRPKRYPDVFDRARSLMGTSLQATWGMEDSAYALTTLRNAGYRTIGIYDCDLGGTVQQLQQLADHMVMDFTQLDAATFLKWATA